MLRVHTGNPRLTPQIRAANSQGGPSGYVFIYYLPFVIAANNFGRSGRGAFQVVGKGHPAGYKDR